MKRVLPALHEGHAPIHLQEAFSAALEALEAWRHGEAEPLVGLQDEKVPVSAVFGRMRTCDDIVPARDRPLLSDILDDDDLSTERDMTYAQVSVPLRARCVERLRSG